MDWLNQAVESALKDLKKKEMFVKQKLWKTMEKKIQIIKR